MRVRKLPTPVEYTAAGFFVRTKVQSGHIDMIKATEKIQEIYPKQTPGVHAAVIGRDLVIQMFFSERSVDALTY